MNQEMFIFGLCLWATRTYVSSCRFFRNYFFHNLYFIVV